MSERKSTRNSFVGADGMTELENNATVDVEGSDVIGNDIESMEDNFSEEICMKLVAFAQLLKGWDDNSMIIVLFHDILFNLKCREASPTHNPTINNNLVVPELFKEDEDWVDRETLFQAVKSVGKVLGFHITKKQQHIQCNRFGNDRSIRNYTEGPLRVGCTFHLTLKAH